MQDYPSVETRHTGSMKISAHSRLRLEMGDGDDRDEKWYSGNYSGGGLAMNGSFPPAQCACTQAVSCTVLCTVCAGCVQGVHVRNKKQTFHAKCAALFTFKNE